MKPIKYVLALGLLCAAGAAWGSSDRTEPGTVEEQLPKIRANGDENPEASVVVLGTTSEDDGHVLVMGDYRGNSRDGRYFGTVPVSELYGRASGVFWRGKPLWKTL